MKKAARQWERIGLGHHHGIALPLFSLRREGHGMIGEYRDLIPLIDWCTDVGFSVIQLLPLNDSGPDPSPYSALSAFALNPLYLTLEPLASTERVDYPAVREAKLEQLTTHIAEHRHELLRQEEYHRFLHDNPWLVPYGLFKALREEHNRTAWWEWPDRHRHPIPELASSYEAAISFHSMVQYICDQQLRDVRAHADSRGVKLFGDIPILLSPNSADVWWHQPYFDLDATVGAPPDQYSEEGQNWGFPLYRWEALAADDYQWWRHRLSLAERYFHLYRLDHVVGFFRFWQIPKGRPGVDGHFVPANLADALSQGRHLLEVVLESSSMLPIGEDLGAVPPEVRQEMHQLGVCGTKVMRWERDWQGDGSFLPVSQYPPESMTCVSTHDSEPLALWWKAHPDESKRYASEHGWEWQPDLAFDQRIAILRESHQSGSLFHINPLQEYLALDSSCVHDDLADERINVPGTMSDKNWTYRFLPSIEKIATNRRLMDTIGGLFS